MSRIYRFKNIAPQTRKQKQYLAILKLYSEHDIARICSVLNCKFEDSLFRRNWEIEEAMTDALWDSMIEDQDEVLQWAQRQGANGWRVRRVLAYAEAH